MTNYKLKTISNTEMLCFTEDSMDYTNWYICEDDITEYKDFFFDELLFDLARPWPLGIKDCKYFAGSGDDREGEKDDNRWAFRGHGGTLSVENYPASLKNIKNWEYIFDKYKPKSILETGTNSGIFGFLCYKFLGNDFELTTIDCEPNSKICVDKVNKYFNNDLIEFHKLDILNGMEDFEVEKELDFVFLDSGHDTGILTAELDFVIRNNISVIAFDDYSLPQVDEMIKKFLTDNTNYQLVETFNGLSGSGMGDIKIVKQDG
jgi:hypothetical protein|tara:strand:+ start:1070 stop:1855 length:786 start_codon:yes stop_codon:yes gene_type:complete